MKARISLPARASFVSDFTVPIFNLRFFDAGDSGETGFTPTRSPKLEFVPPYNELTRTTFDCHCVGGCCTGAGGRKKRVVVVAEAGLRSDTGKWAVKGSAAAALMTI